MKKFQNIIMKLLIAKVGLNNEKVSKYNNEIINSQSENQSEKNINKLFNSKCFMILKNDKIWNL